MTKSKLTYLKKIELFNKLNNFKDEHFFAIIDQRIKNHLPQWIQFSPDVYWLKNPEEQKNLDTFGEAAEFFLKQGVDRKSQLFALGGGATTDLAGFVASTIVRGIRWTSIPTTLLGMVDGSIGGKVAVNMPAGKNLVGAFHAPENVYICTEFLTTLTETEWQSGRGEILKYGFLSKKIHDKILGGDAIEDIAIECANYKIHVVEEDFHDHGERVYLNLGHTLGHAFESVLKAPHGIAVGMGLKYLFQVMRNDELLEDWQRMATALALPQEKMEISHYPRFELSDFLAFLDHDKKKVNTKIRLVLVKKIGSCYIEEMELKEFKARFLDNPEFKPQ